MSLSKIVAQTLETAEAKALATCGPDGINVVPVSMVKVNNDSIWLFDFFMNKTAKNIKDNTSVALSAWTGMTGVQIKGDITYITDGDEFDKSVAWCGEQNPDRVVKALIILKPTKIFDISPGGAYQEEDLEI
jgi:predicted pyridoxine 5'-phosphate oxidase superfamily flavin-nucleotide-binding protein